MRRKYAWIPAVASDERVSGVGCPTDDVESKQFWDHIRVGGVQVWAGGLDPSVQAPGARFPSAIRPASHQVNFRRCIPAKNPISRATEAPFADGDGKPPMATL